MPHFTLMHGPLGPLIHAYIGLSEPRVNALVKASLPLPPPILVKALVDTGASHSVVDPTVVKALLLAPRRIANTITPTTGAAPHKCHTYDVSIHVPILPATPLFSKMAWEVTCLEIKHQGFEAIIGRDILADCVVIYDGRAGTFTMAF